MRRTSAHLGSLAIAAVALAGTWTVQEVARHGRLPGGAARWERTNHAGDPVTLTEGVALTAGTALPLLVVDPPATLAVLGAGAAGALDDLDGSADAKGLRGHLTALRHGRVTTGTVKIAALGASGLLATAWSDRRAGRPVGLHTLTGGALVAGAANLANLFDLRPGRALKVGLLTGVPLAVAGRPPAASVVGAALAALPEDLAGRAMLGDTGANPLGSAVGLAAAQALGPRGRALALGGVSALILASERVSFSAVIDGNAFLRRIDRWGRSA